MYQYIDRKQYVNVMCNKEKKNDVTWEGYTHW